MTRKTAIEILAMVGLAAITGAIALFVGILFGWEMSIVAALLIIGSAALSFGRMLDRQEQIKRNTA